MSMNGKTYYLLASATRLVILLSWLTGCSLSTASAPIDKSVSTEKRPDVQLWVLDSLQEVAGLPLAMLGDPALVVTPFGRGIAFDGKGDRILLNTNPLAEAEEFTIEVIIKPYDAFPDNWEPRFLHLESPDDPNRRITIELRLNANKQWYLDAYIKSELSQFTLIDTALVHPVDEWAHVAITYKNQQFTSYVNGQQELTAAVDYLPIAANAQVSIGARINEVHWFNGVIQAVRFTPKVLATSNFLSLE